MHADRLPVADQAGGVADTSSVLNGFPRVLMPLESC
jgi:hypothetical protein